MHQTVHILLYKMQSGLGPTVALLAHNLVQWRCYKRKRCTQLVRYIYKEALSHLIHLLLVLLFLMLANGLLFLFLAFEQESEHSVYGANDEQQIHKLGYPCGIPWWQYLNS